MTDIREKRLNPYDPFDNPTENCAYRTDYREIEPKTGTPGYELPLIPEKQERKRIRHFFNAAGLGLLAGALGVNIVFIIVTLVLEMIMAGSFDYDALMDADQYLNFDSSILIALNGLMFLFANLIPAVVGSRLTGIRIRSYFRPMNVKKIQFGKYMLIGIFIQAVTGILYEIVQSVMQSGGISDYTSDIDTYVNSRAIIATAIYTCIVAPVTEELLYRGFVLKNLSRVSLRFGIIGSALLFGLAHENIGQFMLAVPAGIFMARIVTKHNSIIPSILVHMALNTTAFFTSWIAESLPVSRTGTIISFIVDVVYYFIAGAGMILWIMEVRRNRLPANTIRQSYRGVRIALTSPFLMAVIIFHTGMAVIAIAMQNI